MTVVFIRPGLEMHITYATHVSDHRGLKMSLNPKPTLVRARVLGFLLLHASYHVGVSENGGFPKLGVPTIMENQMEKKMENEMETHIGDYRD